VILPKAKFQERSNFKDIIGLRPVISNLCSGRLRCEREDSGHENSMKRSPGEHRFPLACEEKEQDLKALAMVAFLSFNRPRCERIEQGKGPEGPLLIGHFSGGYSSISSGRSSQS
jgi:hypothetical protein